MYMFVFDDIMYTQVSLFILNASVFLREECTNHETSGKVYTKDRNIQTQPGGVINWNTGFTTLSTLPQRYTNVSINMRHIFRKGSF